MYENEKSFKQLIINVFILNMSNYFTTEILRFEILRLEKEITVFFIPNC